MNDKIFLIVGESGCGKDTIVNKLCETYGYKKLISYTTRPVRVDDAKDKAAHIFVSDEEFDKLTDLVAYTKFNDYRYCATTQQVEESDIYIIDYAGIQYFKQKYKGNKTPYVIYISTPKADRFLRMKYRQGNTSTATAMALERITHDKQAFAGVQNIADYIVDNSQTGEDAILNVVDHIHNIMSENEVK